MSVYSSSPDDDSEMDSSPMRFEINLPHTQDPAIFDIVGQELSGDESVFEDASSEEDTNNGSEASSTKNGYKENYLQPLYEEAKDRKVEGVPGVGASSVAKKPDPPKACIFSTKGTIVSPVATKKNRSSKSLVTKPRKEKKG